MKKAISLNLKTWVLLSLTMFVGGTFIGCQEEVDQSNRFTFKGEVIATHLENNPDKYSHFVDILKKASIGVKSEGTLFKTLSTYGAYTCFAPIDDAVEKFVQEQYNIYKTSVENNAIAPELYPIIETGVTSPNVSDLSEEKCTEIARNHVIEDEFKTVDFSAGFSLPKTSMSYRTILTNTDIVNNERVYYVGINNAEIIEPDIATYNGTVHSIAQVINPSTDNAAEILNQSDGISIFREALNKTGLQNLLAKFELEKDYDNTMQAKKFDGQPGQTPLYPETKNQGFTLLIEPNEVLMDPTKNSFGMTIATWQDMAEFAEKVYGSEPGYEEVYDHPKNALFKFISYHIIDRQLDFVKNGVGGWIMEGYDRNSFNSESNMDQNYDWSDYFETYLPYDEWTYTEEEVEAIRNGNVDEGCMIKVTRPYTNAEFKNDVVINICNTTPGDMMFHHTNIRVLSQTKAQSLFPETLGNVALDPENAKIHFIDKILVYNEDEMKKNIINERMRWDPVSCFPELTTNRVRWNFNTGLFTYIPAGGDDSPNERQFCKRLRARNNDTEIFYLRPYPTGEMQYTNFQGDELLIEGKYDAEYRLPHVPAGTYEIRIGFSMSTRRGVVQFYLDGDICGIPTDMRMDEANKNRIGWFADEELTEDEISDEEKAMRNRGYMKAPASILVGNKTPMRDSSNAMRRIVATNLDLEPTKEGHWLRVKNVTEASVGAEEFNQDYLEIVPKSIYNNPANPEDRY
ncbi:MAG: fasciclin domain-containing protein [Bacteroidaceae bacterium]|nr:fasciclin domain-containing protein [Bacteroidaceae bacterium]